MVSFVLAEILLISPALNYVLSKAIYPINEFENTCVYFICMYNKNLVLLLLNIMLSVLFLRQCLYTFRGKHPYG